MKSEIQQIDRYFGLDWLRGLMAVSIMMYHYVRMVISPPEADSLLGRLSIYGVAIFFILSGLSLAIAYHGYIRDIKTSTQFYVRRFFRIFPLMWLAIFLVFFLGSIRQINFQDFLLNITGIFGFINSGNYIFPGGWSLGNEIVYYAWTPLIILLFNRKILYGNVFFLMSIIIGVFFPIFFLNNGALIDRQWGIYANSFNSLFLFVSGIAMYYNFREIKINKSIIIFLAIVSFLAFFIIPAQGDRIVIVTGTNRLLFSLISMVTVFLFWKVGQTVYPKVNKLFSELGASSYPVYLLHSFVLVSVFPAFGGLVHKIPYFVILISGVLTVTVSLLIHRCLELPFVMIGKKITSGGNLSRYK